MRNAVSSNGNVEALLKGDGRRMKFPQGSNLRTSASAGMLKILEWQAEYAYRQRLRKVAAVLEIERESMLLQLLLNRMPRGTIFTIYRSLDDHARRGPVGSLGDLQVNIAICGIDACVFQVGLRYVS